MDLERLRQIGHGTSDLFDEIIAKNSMQGPDIAGVICVWVVIFPLLRSRRVPALWPARDPL